MRDGTEVTSYTSELSVTTVTRDGQNKQINRDVLRESTIEVYVNGIRSMRLHCTPMDLKELVIGRLHSEGYIHSYKDIQTLQFSEDYSSVQIQLTHDEKPEESVQLDIVPTTGGKGDIIRKFDLHDTEFVSYEPIPWDKDSVFKLFDDFVLDTPLHSITKGTHSCRLAVDNEIVYISEDIGRHNAFDKAIGYVLIHSIEIARTIFFSSGRVPVDMASKAIRAQIPVFASKAAPTDQAVELARQYGLTLIGLVDSDQLLVFSGDEYEKSKLAKEAR